MPGPSVPTGSSITEAVTILGNKLRDYQGQFNTMHLVDLCDYFHNTFIHHYRLYQYVLGQDQEVNLTVTHLVVCVPPQPLPLAEGVDRETWKHEQQVGELSLAEAQKHTNVLLLKEALHLEQEHLLESMFSERSWQRSRVLKREVRLCWRGGRMLICHVQTPVPAKRTSRLESDAQAESSCLHTGRGQKRQTVTEDLLHTLCARFTKRPCEYNSCPHFNDETTEAQKM